MTTRGVTIVAGVSGSGKSLFALRYLVNAPLTYRFIFDRETGPQSYAERLKCDAAGDGYELALQLCTGWVVFNPHVMFAGRLSEGFNFFCDWAYTMSQRLPGRKVILIDEAWRYITPQRYPIEAAQCVQSGRAYGLACMFNTQQAHSLHEAIKNECSELVCFTLHGEKSLRFVQDKGLDAAEVEALPQLSFVARNIDSGGELRGKLRP